MLNPYAQILRHARSGSPERAWSLLAQHGLLDSDDDARALTLQARLVKDRARRAGKGPLQAQLFDQSAQLYAKAAGLVGASYPLINAASLSLLAGQPRRAQQLARQVLDLIEGNAEEGETPYWREATRAEALLLLGLEPEARAALRMAIARQPQAWEDHAATISQFALILQELGSDAGWLDQHRPPPSVHFSGIAGLAPESSGVEAALADYIRNVRPGFAFGALAAGADLLFAEAFIAWRDQDCPAAELHVVLPYPVDQFRQLSVTAFGAHWPARFDAVLAQASSTTVYGLDDPSLTLAVEYADLAAMGRAIRNAQVLASKACAVTVIGAGEALRPQLAAWRERKRPLTIIEGSRSASTGPDQSHPAIPREQLLAVVWASAANSPADPASAPDMAQQSEGQSGGTAGRWSVHDDLLTACALAAGLARADEGAHVALCLAPCDPDRPTAALLQRVAALAAAAVRSAVVTDQVTAMALIGAGWGGSIEELGELPLPSGLEPVWCVA